MNKNILKLIFDNDYIQDFCKNTYIIESMDYLNCDELFICTCKDKITAIKNFIYNCKDVYSLFNRFYTDNSNKDKIYKQKYCDLYMALCNLDIIEYNKFVKYFEKYNFKISIKTINDSIKKDMIF